MQTAAKREMINYCVDIVNEYLLKTRYAQCIRLLWVLFVKLCIWDKPKSVTKFTYSVNWLHQLKALMLDTLFEIVKIALLS